MTGWGAAAVPQAYPSGSATKNPGGGEAQKEARSPVDKQFLAAGSTQHWELGCDAWTRSAQAGRFPIPSCVLSVSPMRPKRQQDRSSLPCIGAWMRSGSQSAAPEAVPAWLPGRPTSVA